MRRFTSLIVATILVHGLAMAVAAKEKTDAGADMKETAKTSRKRVAESKILLVSGFASLQKARTAGDSGRVDCIQETLKQMKGLVRLASGSMLQLEEEQSTRNSKAVEHNAVKIKVATDKVKDEHRRLEACTGKQGEGVQLGTLAQVQVDADPDIPNIDPVEGLKDLSTTLESPPSASPFFN